MKAERIKNNCVFVIAKYQISYLAFVLLRMTLCFDTSFICGSLTDVIKWKSLLLYKAECE